MGVVSSWARERLAPLACAIVLVSSCGGWTPPPSSPAQPTSTSRPSPPPAKLSPWRPIEGEPQQVGSAAWVVRAGDDEIRADHGGVRWLIPKEGRGHRANTFDPPLSYVTYEPSVGLLAVTRESHLLHAPGPLDDWRDMGTVPPNVDFDSVAAYQGQISIRRRGGVLVGSVDGVLRDVVSMGGRRAYDVRIGKDGRGLGLFVPQAVGVTTDHGNTWTAIDDSDLHVSALHAKGATVVLTPGGDHDEFVRVWEPGATSLVRALAVDTTASGARPGVSFDTFRDRPPSIGPKGTEHKSERYPWLTRIVRGATPIDDNTLGVFADGWYGVRELGEATSWHDIPSKTCVVARCGHVHAFACERVVYVVRDLDDLSKAETLRISHSASSAAFAGPNTIVVVGSRGMTTIDVSGPATAGRTWVEDGRLSYDDRVVGRCGGPNAGAWLIGPYQMYQVDASESGLRPQEAAKWIGPQRYIGLDEANRPVFLSSSDQMGGGEPLLGKFDAEGQWREIKLPFEPRDMRSPDVLTRLESLRSGRGLLFDRDSHPWVTADGGDHWTSIPSPAWAPEVGNRRVVCGASRCEVENTAVYVGWELDPSQLATDALVDSENAASPKSSVTKEVRHQLTCKIGATVDTGKLRSRSLHFGVGASDFTAILVTPIPEYPYGEDAPKQFELASLHVKATGRDTLRRLALLRESMSPIYGYNPTADVEDGVVAFLPSVTSIPVQSVTWDRGPGTPLVRTRWGQGLLTRTSIHIVLQAEDGVALVDGLTSDILWLRADGKQERRPWPNQWADLEPGWDAGPYRAWIVERPDGTWLSALHTQGRLELVEIAKDGFARYRSMFPGPDMSLARMITLGGQATMLGVEHRQDGKAELRARGVMPSLSLGDARTLGVFDFATARMDLPPCSDATGRAVSVSLGTGSVSFGGEAVTGELVHLIRVTPSSTCIGAEQVANSNVTVVRKLPGTSSLVMKDDGLARAECDGS